MGGTTSSLLPGRGVTGTLSSLFVLFALAPAPAFAGVVNEPGNETADSLKIAAEAAEEQCTVRFEYEYVGIGEGIFAVLFVVMDTKTVLIDDVERRVACYQGKVTIQHDRYANTEEDDYTFGSQNARTATLSFAPIQDQHDGTTAFSVNVHEDSDDDEDDEGLTVTFVDDHGNPTTTYRHNEETVEVVNPATMFITINPGGPRTPKPGAPQSLSPTTGDAQVTLSWSPPANNGGATITGYEYRYAESSGSYPSDWTSAGGSGASSVTVSNLSNGTSYQFQVRARNSAGGGTPAETNATPTSGGGTPSLSIADVTVREGGGSATLTVTLSTVSSQTVTVGYATEDGNATAGTDYAAVPNGSVSIQAGQPSAQISISITDDSDQEGNETFNVRLSSPSNATIGDGQRQSPSPTTTEAAVAEEAAAEEVVAAVEEEAAAAVAAEAAEAAAAAVAEAVVAAVVAVETRRRSRSTPRCWSWKRVPRRATASCWRPSRPEK